MTIQLDRRDHLIQIIINVLIIEDSFEQALSIKNSVDSYLSILNGKRDIFGDELDIIYHGIINGKKASDDKEFNGNLAFADSVAYLQDSTNNIDIILCDYDLGNIKGNKLFEQAEIIEKQINCRWYWVLHSVGYEYLRFQNKRTFTCDSKHKEAVQEVSLRTFEEKILQSILFGNQKQFGNMYSISNEGDFKVKTHELYDDIPFERILTVHSTKHKEQYKVYFLDNDFSVCDETRNESLITLKESPLFISISKGFMINKLWIGDFDIATNRIKFIRNANQQFILDIEKEIKGKTHKPKLIEYFSTLFRENKMKSSDELISTYPHFRF